MPIALGLMSGTSCDGVSAALVEFRGCRFRLLGYRTTAYAPPLAELLRRWREWTVAQTAQANILLGELFARSAVQLLRATRTDPRRVEVIGSHGHTVYHGPSDAIPCTLQLGEPAIIAQRTGRPVVADFRMRDVAAGGQGAPLTPFFDQHSFGDGAPRAMQNIGGIANVALVGRGVAPLAFDTGPGNSLIDAAVRRMTRGRRAFDPGGRLAKRGRVDRRAVARLWRHPYFRRRPPKSTGPELFNERLIEDALGRQWLRRADHVLATLTFFTAFSIAESYRRFLPVAPREVIVSGGGALNHTLMEHLAALLAPIPVGSIAAYGLHPQAKEPVAFALLALRALRGQTNHLPSTTGASRACILGTLTPALLDSATSPRRHSATL